MALAMLSVEITHETSFRAKKIFQVERSLGKTSLMKLLVFILKNFCDSVKIPPERKPEAHELIELADEISKKYTHESVEDLILAFKTAKIEGMTVYNSFSVADIYQIIKTYLERVKTPQIEQRVLDLKVRGKSSTASFLEAFPASFANIIFDTDMNSGHKRLKMTISKHLAKRNIKRPRTPKTKRVLRQNELDLLQTINLKEEKNRNKS